MLKDDGANTTGACLTGGIDGDRSPGGKVIDREARLIGAVLFDSIRFPTVVALVRPERFRTPLYRAAFAVMLTRSERGQDPGDIVALRDELDRAGILAKYGGAQAIARTLDYATAAYAEDDALAISELYRQREAAQLLTTTLARLASTGTDECAHILARLHDDLDQLEPDPHDLAGASLSFARLWAQNPEDPPSILGHGLIVPGELTLLVGAAGTGKTFLMLELALCLALGRTFHGFTVREPQRVAVLELEASPAEIVSRGRRTIAGLRLTADDAHTALERVQVVTKASALRSRVNFAEDWRQVCSWIRATKTTVLLVDSFSRTHGGNENEDMGGTVAAYERILSTTGCAIVALHHEPKTANGAGSGSRTDTLYATRGPTILTDAAKCQMRLSEQRGKLCLRFGKVNSGPTPDPAWLERLEADDPGAGVLIDTDPPLDKAAKASANLKKVADTLREAHPEWCSIRELMEKTGLAEGTVRKDCKALVTAGEARGREGARKLRIPLSYAWGQ
jgi:hypothetical protein